MGRYWKWNSPPMCKRYLKFALEGVSSSMNYYAGGSSSWPDSSSPACSTSLSGAAAGDIHIAIAVVAPVADDITDFVNNNAKGGRRELRFKSMSKMMDKKESTRSFSGKSFARPYVGFIRFDPCSESGGAPIYTKRRELEEGRELKFLAKVEASPAKKLAAAAADDLGPTYLKACKQCSVSINPKIETAKVTYAPAMFKADMFVPLPASVKADLSLYKAVRAPMNIVF